jgi:hypothetical protein
MTCIQIEKMAENMTAENFIKELYINKINYDILDMDPVYPNKGVCIIDVDGLGDVDPIVFMDGKFINN